MRLADERDRLARTGRDGLPPVGPHDHLSHRRLPIAAAERGRSRFLSAWAIISTPLVLWIISVLFRQGTFSRWQIGLGALVLVLAVEAFARGYLVDLLVRLLLLLLLLNFVVLFVGNWQLVISVSLAVVAFIVLFVNIRDARGR